MVVVGTKKATPRREPQNQEKITSHNEALSMLVAATKKRPLTRVRLQILLDADDRTVRRWIQSVRDAGLPVCSSSHNYGYWLAQTEEEYDAFEKEYLSHAKAQMRTAKRMRKAFQG